MAGTGLQGAYALQSLDDLMQRRLAERLAAEAQAEKIRQFNVGAGEREREHRARESELALNRQIREDTQAEQVRQHEGQRAERIANTAYPEDIATPEAQTVLQKTGFGGALRTVAQDPFEGVDPSRMGELPMISGRLRGGANYLTQQSIAAQRAATAESARESRETIASARSEAKAGQDAIENQFRQQGLNIQGQLAQSTLGTRAEKSAESAKANEAKRLGAVDEADQVLRLAEEFEASPGAPRIFGLVGALPNVPGGAAASAQTRLEQLKASLAIGKIQEMKAQSRTGATGFGQLSEKELAVLENAAGRLQRAQSFAEAKTALAEIKGRMRVVIARNRAPGSTAEPAAAGPVKKSAADWLKEQGF